MSSFLRRTLRESGPKAQHEFSERDKQSRLSVNEGKGGTEYERISNINQTGEA